MRVGQTQEIKPVCTCDSMDLFKGGCTCGAVVPYKSSLGEKEIKEDLSTEPEPVWVGIDFGMDCAAVEEFHRKMNDLKKKMEDPVLFLHPQGFRTVQ